MKKGWLLLLTVTFLSLIFLTACGSNSNDQEAEGQDPDEVETEENVEPEDETDAIEEQAEEEGTEPDENDSEDVSESGDVVPPVVAENDAFRVFEPAPDSIVGNEFVVRGEARVFEATFQYEFEDGHDILDQGTIMASHGAPEWGEFEFTVSFDDVFFDTGILILFQYSAKDGSRVNELFIPLKVEK